jgi:hypothetical protein
VTSKRFCEACPARNTSRPAEPCPRALERIHAIQAEGVRSKIDPDSLPGCPWAINSATHQYCFWVLCQELDEPLSDREICNLLGINQQTLEKTLQSALLKLQAMKGTEVMSDLIEAVADATSSQDPDNTVYLPDSYTKVIEQTPDEPEEDEDAKLAEEAQKPRRDNSMPMHRSGNKRDLYGIYGKKKLEEMLRKKREAKK